MGDNEGLIVMGSRMDQMWENWEETDDKDSICWEKPACCAAVHPFLLFYFFILLFFHFAVSYHFSFHLFLLYFSFPLSFWSIFYLPFFSWMILLIYMINFFSQDGCKSVKIQYIMKFNEGILKLKENSWFIPKGNFWKYCFFHQSL